MALFWKIWKKYNEIQLTKYKMNLNNLKMIIGIKTTSGAMPKIVVALIYR